jgi:hypothetical protein
MTLVTAWMPWRHDVDLLVPAGTSTRLDWIQCGFKKPSAYGNNFRQISTKCCSSPDFVILVLNEYFMTRTIWYIHHFHPLYIVVGLNWGTTWVKLTLRGRGEFGNHIFFHMNLSGLQKSTDCSPKFPSNKWRIHSFFWRELLAFQSEMCWSVVYDMREKLGPCEHFFFILVNRMQTNSTSAVAWPKPARQVGPPRRGWAYQDRRHLQGDLGALPLHSPPRMRAEPRTPFHPGLLPHGRHRHPKTYERPRLHSLIRRWITAQLTDMYLHRKRLYFGSRFQQDCLSLNANSLNTISPASLEIVPTNGTIQFQSWP